MANVGSQITLCHLARYETVQRSTPCSLQIFPFSASPECLATSTTTPILRTFQSEGPVSISHLLLGRATRPIARRTLNRARQVDFLPSTMSLSDLGTEALRGCYTGIDDSYLARF